MLGLHILMPIINAQIKELDALFPGGEQIPNLKQPHFDKEKTYFKAVNNQ